MLEEFHFLRPIWFAALVVLLPLSWYWFKRTRSASGWRSAVSKELLAVLLDAQQPRSGRWLRGLMLTAIVVWHFWIGRTDLGKTATKRTTEK